MFNKAGSTLRSSQAVPHPSTNRALRRLTSEVRRDPVHSTRYGRRREKMNKTSRGVFATTWRSGVSEGRLDAGCRVPIRLVLLGAPRPQLAIIPSWELVVSILMRIQWGMKTWIPKSLPHSFSQPLPLSLLRPCIRRGIPALMPLIAHSCDRLFTHRFLFDSRVYSLMHLFVCLLIHFFVHPLDRSLIHSLPLFLACM